MKKFMMTLFAVLTIAASANAMSFEQARSEALFLTDKMAYELNLTDDQYEAAYEINLDYLMGVTGRSDVFGSYWERRNLDLSYILYSWQWEAFCAATYFYRPLYWEAGYWHFGIYARYPRRDYFYFGTPHFFVSYRGGHSWRMNGGRSYYEGRVHHYRPGHGHHDHHVGMRDGWNRGDYRGHGNSSTRITGGTRRGDSYRDRGVGRGTTETGRNGGVGRGTTETGRNGGVGRGNTETGRNGGVGRGTTEGTRSGQGRSTSSGSRYTGGSFRNPDASSQRSLGSSTQRSIGSSSQRTLQTSPQRPMSSSSSVRSSGSLGRSAGSFGSSSGSTRGSMSAGGRSTFGGSHTSSGSSMRSSGGSHSGGSYGGGSHGGGSSRR